MLLNALNMSTYHNRNTECYTKRGLRLGLKGPAVGGAGVLVSGAGPVRIWAVAAGSEGGRGSKTRGVRPLYIHSDEEKISQCQTPGLVLQKKEGAAGGAAGRVETAGETALFQATQHQHTNEN